MKASDLYHRLRSAMDRYGAGCDVVVEMCAANDVEGVIIGLDLTESKTTADTGVVWLEGPFIPIRVQGEERV